MPCPIPNCMRRALRWVSVFRMSATSPVGGGGVSRRHPQVDEAKPRHTEDRRREAPPPPTGLAAASTLRLAAVAHTEIRLLDMRLGQQGGGGAGSDDTPLLQDIRAVGDRERLHHVLLDDQDRDALVVDRAD